MPTHYSLEMVAKLLATTEELTTKLDFSNKKIFKLESKVEKSCFNASKNESAVL
jgi:hypothetical protein